MRVVTSLPNMEYQEHFSYLFTRMVEVCKRISDKGLWTSSLPVPASIEDLAVYYQYLEVVRNHSATEELIRIPAEEEYFEINANTREIIIPDHFAKYGLSVQGDHMAEMVFFKIDRFFDDMDLAICTKETDDTAEYGGRCFIQWRLGDLGEPHETDAWAAEIRDEDIIFGWPLSEQATRAAGELQFSVRFVMFKNSDKSSYDYSLSTTTAKCKILPGLDYDPGIALQDDYKSLLVTRPIYSNIMNSSFGARPVFTDKGNLPSVSNLDNTGKYVLTIKGHSPDLGTLSVRWFQDLPHDEYNEIQVPEYIPDEMGQNSVQNPALAVSAPQQPGGEYTFTYTVTQPGSYYGILSNYNPEGNVRSVSSEVCVIPHASTFDVVEHIPARAYSDGDSEFIVNVSNANGIEPGVPQNEFNGLSYQWQIRDPFSADVEESWVNVENGQQASWTPPVDTDGYIRCVITNKRNNDTHVEYTQTNSELRALPKPPQVDGIITGQTVSGVKGYRVNVTDKDTRDLRFRWNDNYTPSSTDEVFVIDWNNPGYKQLLAEGKDKITIQCQVSRCIWADDASRIKWSDDTIVTAEIKVGEYGVIN